MRVTGFPSPADEYGVVGLSLHEHLVPSPNSTYFVRVAEELAPNVRVGDLLVVDRAVAASNGGLVLVVLDGQLCLRRFHRRGPHTWLMPLAAGAPKRLQDGDENTLWGSVTYVIHRAQVA